ncbi:MAG: hypothetical protein E7394_04150 [Ruminococcaceae bacterium]|nr:hypothetical protein [Oscillospiraceae bacterium]
MNSSQKKIMKKFLSVILSVSILASLCSFGAMASSYELVEDKVYYNGDFDTDTKIETWVGNPVTDSSSAHGKVGPLVSDADKVYSLYADTTKYGPTADGDGKGTMFRYSFDAKWVGNFPTKDNSALFEFNYYKPDNNTDWYIPLSINSDGSLSTASDIKLSLGKWYNFSYDVTFMQNDTNTIVTDITVTDEETGTKYIAAQDLKRNNVVTFMNKHVIYRKNMGTDANTCLYVDNLKWARIKEAVPEISIAASVSGVTEIPAGNKVKFSYETLYASDILGANGGYVKVFNNGVQVGGNLLDDKGTFDVAISEGINVISAEIYNADGKTIVQSAEYTMTGLALDTNASVPGYCVDFDDVKNNGEFKGTGTTTSYSYDDPDETRGEGKVAYRQYDASQTSNLKYQPANIATNSQGRFVEISADVKSNAPTNQRNFNIINLTSFYSSTGNEGWSTGGIYALGTGKIACYNANGVTDVDVDLNNWHNYKILFDTNATGTPRAYYFVDDVLIYHQASASTNIRAIRQAQFEVTYDGTNAIDLYLDNVTMKTYDIAASDATVVNLTAYQGTQRITSKSQIDSAKVLSIKGSLIKVNETDESVDVYVAFVKEKVLEKIKVANVEFDASTQSFEIPVEGLPTDISTGDYEIKLFVWDENLTPYYGPWYSVLK